MTPTIQAPNALPDDEVAQRALDAYDLPDDAVARLLNLSENATYLIERPESPPLGVLRVHRDNYHSRESIQSELAWLTALRNDAGIATPVVLPAQDGRHVVTVEFEKRQRHAVLFEVMGGAEPDQDALTSADFQTLGELTARLHQHARSWARPAGFTRFAWDWEHTLGGQPRWGRWQDGIGIGPTETELLERLGALVRHRLNDYGNEPQRYGLAHADLRPANLLIDDEHVNVIDFDDCGFTWFLYDFGTAVSFFEDDPRLGEWQSAWVAGYRGVVPLSSFDEQMLATFVMLRRLLLVAWMGSHSHTRECQELGPSYAEGTCTLAERYLVSDGLTL